MGAGAALAYAVPALAWRALGERRARWALVVAWALHAAALGWALLGGHGGARFGFAQALSGIAPDADKALTLLQPAGSLRLIPVIG